MQSIYKKQLDCPYALQRVLATLLHTHSQLLKTLPAGHVRVRACVRVQCKQAARGRFLPSERGINILLAKLGRGSGRGSEINNSLKRGRYGLH